MILHPIIDLLKRIVVALPDYTGGGGGVSDIVKYEYVQVSDWSSTGDTKGFFQTYCNHGNGLYYAEITNNDVGDYSAIKGIFNRGMISNLYGICQRQTNITTGVDSGYSFRIAPGANIVVWYVSLGVLV